MRKLLLLSFSFAAMTGNAQTIATFDDLTLPKKDTFYVNLTMPGKDVGFNDGKAYFPCEYDTASGSYYFSGVAYSNDTDSVTSGYTNEYAAKTAKGYGGSDNYAVVYVGAPVTIKLTGAAIGRTVRGFYATNSTYAYNSMRDGDTYAKKFGDSDWFKLTILGYSHGVLQTDTVNFYLADFRSPNASDHYILNTWKWVSLLPLGNVDSIQFVLSSSDTGMYGMNTPAYFCIDNFTTNDSTASVVNTAPLADIKIYPNPVANTLYIEQTDNLLQHVNIFDAVGHMVDQFSVNGKILTVNTSSYAAGTYLLQLSGSGKMAAMRFIKQ